MPELKLGSTAPDFSLSDKDGRVHSLSRAKSDYTVVYFYPKDDTPGCTIEAKDFSDHLEKFEKAGIAVYGISGGSDKTKASFCKKHGLSVPLLSDPDFKVASSFGAYGDKKFMGRSFKGILRKTFILDRKRKVVQVFDTVKVEGHAREVMAAVKALAKSGSAAVKSGKKVKAATPVKAPAKALPKPSSKVAGRKAAKTKTRARVSKPSKQKAAVASKKIAKKAQRKAMPGAKVRGKAGRR